MRLKGILAIVISILLLAQLACSFQTASTPAPVTPPTLPPPTPAVSTTNPSSPTDTSEASTATLEAPTATEEPTLPEPTFATTPSVPLAAAPAHFRFGAPIKLNEIHMFSQTEGWAISGPYVLTTADGGKTWPDATPPGTTSSGAPDQAYGAFLDKQTAWIVFSLNSQIDPEAQVWHTSDGGHTWTPGGPLMHQVVGELIWTEFAVLDAQNIWMLVRGVYHGAGTHFNHELFHTADGGLTWTSLDGQISDDYTGMVFANATFGLRTLQTTGAYAPAPPAYDATNDGGVNWENNELPPPPGAPTLFTDNPYCETYQPTLFSAQSIRMLVGCFDYYDPPKVFSSYLYSTEDGGIHWQSVLLPAKVLAANDRLIYFDSDHALLLGRDSYQTADGGQTWTFVKTVNWDGQFSFVDAQDGWAVATSNGQIALVQTTDGAKTWKEIKPTIGK